MKITVVGHWGGFPESGGATSGYLFQCDGFNMLIDCGSAVLSNLQKYITIEELDAVIISHYHHDHIADIGPLKYAEMIKTKLGIIKKPLLIYGHSYDEEKFNSLRLEPYMKAVPYKESEPLNIGPFTINFCETMHPVKCFAIRISDEQKSIVYTADTSYFEGLKEFAKDAHLLICECNLYKDQDGFVAGHLNSTEAALIAKEAGALHLLLTHLPHHGDISQLLDDAKNNFNGRVELASSGWTWEG